MTDEQISEFDALPDGAASHLDAEADARPDWRRLLGDVSERIKHNLVQNLAIIGAVVLAVVGMGIGLRILLPEQILGKAPPRATLADALAALDREDFDQARSIAADLRLVDDLPPDELGGPAYVLGVVMSLDAENQWERREKRLLFLLATRYLEESRDAGFPQGRRAHGLYVLGKSHHESTHFAKSLEPLEASLDAGFPRQTELHGLLASSYLKDSKPEFDKALEHNRAYLSDDLLSFDQRHSALLLQAQIQFQLEDYTTSAAALSAISADSKQHSRALLLHARIVMHEADELVPAALAATPSDPQRALVSDKYEKARELLVKAQDISSGDEEVVRQAQYLIGQTYRRIAPLVATGTRETAERRTAVKQFRRVRRTHFDTAEGISAALEEAEVLQLLGDDDDAVVAFRRTLGYAADLKPYNNAWVPIDELQNRVEAAYRTYRADGQLRHAIGVASGMLALFSKARAIQLQAEAQQAEAIRLEEQARGLPRSEAEVTLHQSRTDYRKAGVLYAQLAKLRFATRRYPEDLWSTAENYMRGQDYLRAVTYYKRFLATRDRQARPPALTAIGEALLALNKPQDALPWVQECIEAFPRDPHSYRARIIAAQAYRELSNIEQAKLTLLENLEHDKLKPAAVEWRESLFALGDLHYLEGMLHETRSRLQGVNSRDAASRKAGLKQLELAQASFRTAVRKLGEAVQRDPNAPQALEARYHIAESHRHTAKLPRKRLPTVTIDLTRKRLNAEINQELNAAEAGYSKLIQVLNTRHEENELSDVERLILRNCYFARADALYDMESYDEAIKAYSTATNRYQHEPESLEAYVQIANCHRRRNRPGEARGTLEQAKVVLNRIAPGANFTQTTRYDRKQWAELLDWLATL